MISCPTMRGPLRASPQLWLRVCRSEPQTPQCVIASSTSSGPNVFGSNDTIFRSDHAEGSAESEKQDMDVCISVSPFSLRCSLALIKGRAPLVSEIRTRHGVAFELEGGGRRHGSELMVDQYVAE